MMSEQQERLQGMVKNYRPIEELIPAHWSEGEVFANGIRHHYYRTGGEKPVLLLQHGFNENGLTWLRTARELERDYDVIMVDARGHGRSDDIASGFSNTILVEDAAGVIRTLKLGRPRIIGLSQGGSTVLRLAATYPELVHSFIFEGWGEEAQVQSGDFANSPGYQAWFNTWLAWLEQLRTMSHQERMVYALPQLVPTMGGSIWPEEEYVPMVEAYAQFDLELARDSIKLWSTRDKDNAVELLQRVTCPALIMKHAWAFPAPGMEPVVREAASEQPNIRIVYFEHTGHLIRRVAFEQYMTLVWEFLSAN
ncbi:MAG TPA: alpha/beta hydrolase [Ktedonobacteraceae bacterium]